MSKNIISSNSDKNIDNSKNNRYDNVLKNVEVENEEVVEIPADDSTNSNENSKEADTENSEEIEPIMKNGEIVGVYYKCVCGRETEIRFDYSE